MTRPNNRNRKGGPQTNEGKSVASRNSLKGGMYAATLVLPGESQSDFEGLKSALMTELGAQGVIEAAFVHDIAVVTWKKLRLDGLEGRCLADVLVRVETPEDYYEAGFSKGEGVDWALSNLDSLTAEFLDECRQRLAQTKLSKEIIEKRHAEKLEADEAKRIRDEYIERKAQERVKTTGMRITLARMLEEDELGPEEGEQLSNEKIDTMLMVIDEEKRSQAKGAIFVGERLEEVARLKEVIRDRRLAGFLEMSRFQLAHEDLARGLSRALKELRSQQAWRRKNEVIDVTPSGPNYKTD